MRYLVVVEETATGFSAYAPDLPGCVATGSTRDDAQHLIADGMSFMLKACEPKASPFASPTEIAVPEPSATLPPAGVTFSTNAVGGSWFLAVREHQALPHWANALVQGASIAVLVTILDRIRGRFDLVKVLFWGAGWSITGFLSSKWRARRFRTVLSANDLEMTIDRESIALRELVDCELRAERGRSARWSVILKCRTGPEIVALNRLSREQGDFCFEFLSGRVGSRRS